MADKIYATNHNREWCKENNIRITASPKGRPKKISAYKKAKSKREYGRRNQIEGKIGQSKQAYSLNKTKAQLKDTSETWIGLTLFISNIMKFAELKNFNI